MTIGDKIKDAGGTCAYSDCGEKIVTLVVGLKEVNWVNEGIERDDMVEREYCCVEHRKLDGAEEY